MKIRLVMKDMTQAIGKRIFYGKQFLKMGLVIVVLLLGINTTKGQTNCDYWTGTGTVDILYPNGYCANASLKGTKVELYLLNYRINQIINTNELAFEIDWGNGIETVPATDPRISRTLSGSNYLYVSSSIEHYYSATSTCVYNVAIVPVIRGTRCTNLATYNITIWGTDAMMGANMVFVDDDGKQTYYVCEGQEIDITFHDRTLLNCNWLTPPYLTTEEYFLNNKRRHTRFTYGDLTNLSDPQIPSLTVGGTPVTSSTGVLSQFTDDLIRTDNPGKNLDIPTKRIHVDKGITTEGQRFTLRLDNWNACNPYYPDNGTGPLQNPPAPQNAPETTYAYIVVTKAPPPPKSQNNTYCHQDHYSDNELKTLYKITVNHDESKKSLAQFKPGIYRWYADSNNDGKPDRLLLTKNAYPPSTGNTFDPTTEIPAAHAAYRFKTGSDGKYLPGTYTYWVTYQWDSNDPGNLKCETDPVPFTWTLRESIKDAPGVPTGSKEGCSGSTISLYYGTNDNTKPASYTVGGDTKYVWTWVSGTPSPSSAADLVDTYGDGRSVKLLLRPDPTAPATGTITLKVRREWKNSTGVPTNSVCPSDERTVTITVNPLPIAQLNAGADLCSGETFNLKVTNIAGANTDKTNGSKKFSIQLNYDTPIEKTIGSSSDVLEFALPATQTAGTVARYYIYQVKDVTTGCVSTASGADPFTTAKLTTQGNQPVLVIKRPALPAPVITYPTDATLLCANTDFTATANPSPASDVIIPGVNVSKAPAANVIPTNVTLTTTYGWEWFQSATAASGSKQTDNTSATYGSGTAASPGGTQKKLEVQRRYTKLATSGSNCPSAIATVKPTVIPKPTASITSPNLNICENSTAIVDIKATGYSSGTWTVGWKLTKGAYVKTGTATVPFNASGTSSTPYTLQVSDFNVAPNAQGVYTFELTSVTQNTSAACPGTFGPPITITVTQAPSANLTGTGPVCQGQSYIIPAANITLTGVAAVPYEIKYTSSYTGGAQHTVTLNAGQPLTIPAAHISPSAPTTIRFVSVKQNCTGSVVAGNQHVITVIPNAEPAVINTPDQAICANSLLIEAVNVTPANQTDYQGQWKQHSGPALGTFSNAGPNNGSTTFTIGIGGTAYGKYVLVWETRYIGTAPVNCDESTDTLTVIFGKDAQEPLLNVSPIVCGDSVALIATNTLNAWETGSWTTTTAGAVVIPDPLDSRKATGKWAAGNDEPAAVFTFTINTSPGCNPWPKSVPVAFVGRPALVVPGDQTSCPFDADNNSPANQVNKTLTDSKGLSGTQYEWNLSPGIPGVTTPVNSAQVVFDAPANNNAYDMTYSVIARAYRTVSGLTCSTPQKSFNVIVKPKPQLLPMVSQSMCPGEKVTIALNPGLTGNPVTYTWDNTSATQTTGIQDTTIVSSATPYQAVKSPRATLTTDAGGYLVAEANDIQLQAEVRGCYSAKEQFTLTVNPRPKITPPAQSTTYCPGQVINAGSTPATPSFTSNVQNASYQWVYTGNDVGLPYSTQPGDNLGAFTTKTNQTSNNMTGTVAMTVTGPAISNISGTGCVATGTFPVILKPQPVMQNMPNESVCASASAATAVKFPTDISFSVTNLPSGSPTVTYEWYNRGDVAIAGTDYKTLPLATVGSITTTQNLTGTSGTGIFNIGVPTNTTGNNRTATIVVYPYLNGCVGDSSVVLRSAYPLPRINPVPNDTVCPGAVFNPVSFVPTIAVDLVQWTNNDTRIGLGSNGTSNIGAFTAEPNTTGNYIDATITAYAVTYHGVAQCKGPEMTIHKVLKPSPVVDVPAAVNPICPKASFPALTFTSSTTAAVFQSDITYTWVISNNSIGLTSSGTIMPNSGNGNMPSYVGSNNMTGLTATGTVSVSAKLNGCNSANTATVDLKLKPRPKMQTITDKSYCPDVTVPITEIKSNVIGYESIGTVWSLDNPGISIAAPAVPPSSAIPALTSNGTGNIPIFKTNFNTNTGNLVGHFEVSAVVDGCIGDTAKFKVEVKPSPDIANVNNIFLCNKDVQPSITFSSPNFPTATFEWTRTNVYIGDQVPSGTLPTSGTGIIPSFQAINSSTGMLSEVSSVIEVQAKTSGCYSPPKAFAITVGAVPQLGFSNLAACAGPTLKPSDFSTIVDPSVTFSSTDTVYHWKVTDIQPNPPGWTAELDLPQINVDQTGSIGIFHPDTSRTIANNVLWGIQPQLVTIEAYVTLKKSDINGLGCASARNNMYITINPLPKTQIMAPLSDCINDNINVLYQTTQATAGSTYLWGVESDPNTVPNNTWAPVVNNPGNASYQAYKYPPAVGAWRGFITVQETNNFGCKAPLTKLYIKATPAPQVQLDPVPPMCSGDTTRLNAVITNYHAGASYIYTWIGAPIVGKMDTLQPLIRPFSSVNIGLVVNEGNCASSPVNTYVEVKAKPSAPVLYNKDYCSKETKWIMGIDPVSIQAGNGINWSRLDGGSGTMLPIGNSANLDSVMMNRMNGVALYYPDALPGLPSSFANDTVFTYLANQTRTYSYVDGGVTKYFTCASDPAIAQMTLRITPSRPTTIPIAYCQVPGQTTYKMEQPGNNIKWYYPDSTHYSGYMGSTYWASQAKAGTYTYYVTQQGANRCESFAAAKDLIIHQLPALKYDVFDKKGILTTGGCADFTVKAVNKSSAKDPDYTHVNYTWDWGDTSNDNAPTGTANDTVRHLYINNQSIAERRTLTLTGISTANIDSVSKLGCQRDSSMVITVLPGVRAVISIDSIRGCSPFDVMFTSASKNASRIRWYWDLTSAPPDGQAISTNPANQYYGAEGFYANHSFANMSPTTPKDYHVWLQVDNVNTRGEGCYGNADTTITVFPMPGVAFEPDRKSVCPPDLVMFANNSGPLGNNPALTRYEWNFGDGSVDTTDISKLQVYHDYINISGTPINRTIILTAFNKYNTFTCSNSTQTYVTVNPQVIADFLADTAACSPANVTFFDRSVGARTYTWKYGDGNTGSGSMSQHLYVNPSHNTVVPYTVTLTASNNWCKDEVSHPFKLYPQPDAAFVPDKIDGCQPLEVTFTNLSSGNPSNTKYVFDYGDASAYTTNSVLDQPKHTFTNVGGTNTSVIPKLTATNGYGCTNSATTSITIFPYVEADFRMSDSTGCAPQLINFTNGSRGYVSYKWEFGDGDLTTSVLNPSHTFRNTSMYLDSVYFVKLTVTSGANCTSSLTKKVVIHGEPVADFRPASPYPADYIYPAAPIQLENLIPNTPYPDRDSVVYLWSIVEQGSTLTNNFSTLEYPNPLRITTWGKFDITQKVTTPGGHCSDSKTLTINIVPPAPNAKFDAVPPACMPYDVQFKNTSTYGKAYLWSFGDGTTADVKDPKHTYTDAGTYTVTLTVTGDNAYPSTTSRQIIVHPVPQAAFEIHPNFLWVGQTLRAYNYTSNQTSSGQAYDVWYRWNWGDNTPIDTVQNPSHIYLKSGSYDISLTVGTYTTPQCSTTLVLSDAVDLENAGDIILPNTFKPSAAGEPSDIIGDRGYKNYLFYPPVLSPTRKYHFVILNRWGQLLFETTNPAEGWNGYFKGKLCDEGVYIYKIEGVFETGQSFSKMGDILLLR